MQGKIMRYMYLEWKSQRLQRDVIYIDIWYYP